MTPAVAIVGVGGIFPGAPDLSRFWEVVRDGVDTSREAPAGRWVLPPEAAFHADKARPDRVYSKRACFIEGFDLDLTGLDIDRRAALRFDPMVQLALHAGAAAWRDAHTEGLDRRRVGVILGNIALPTESTSKLADWILGRQYAAQLCRQAGATPPPDDRAPVAAINRYVTGLPAGVLARALGLGGGHFTLDAACASSLFALKHAVDELQAGRADAMLTGGLSRPDCLYTQMGFAQLRALSARGRCAPFDRNGDGLVVGEGAGVLLLKRLDDALRAGDHVYAVVRGVGLSNDVDGNLLAPSREGQLRAMRAAYRQAGWAPQCVDLIECHATGTPVGDAVEFKSLSELWGEGDAWRPGQCTVGSVKSNVGHLLTGAGAAGLIKVLLAMREGVLPPTANFEAAAADIDLDGSPFTVRTTAAPWTSDGPRRAAVSGFGFGGTNAHVLLEEWTDGTPASAAGPAPERDDVVIVGMGAAVGPLDDLAQVQHRVLGGDPDRAPAPKELFWGQDDPPRGYFREALAIPHGRFRIPPTELGETLPQQLWMLDVARAALRDARVDGVDRLRTGVFIGLGLDLCTTNYHLRWSFRARAAQYAAALDLPDSGPEFEHWVDACCDGLSPPLNANRVMGNLGGIVASRVAREFALGGPSYVLSTEESSGLTALEAASRALQLGELDCALVGAVDLPSDVRAVFATDLDRPYLRDGDVRPFDAGAAGTLPADGAAALVLKRRRDAERDGDRIYATLRGVGTATGGAPTDLQPPADAYTAAVRRACADGGVGLDGIDLVETHGSGIAAEDRVEATALAAALPGATLASSKADLGHAGAASALLAVVKAALALHHRVLPPLRGVRRPRAGLGDLTLPAAPQYWLRDGDAGPRRALVGSMSVTGACAHAVLEADARAAADPQPLGPPEEHLLVVESDTTGDLCRGLETLAERAAGAELAALAHAWWQEHGQRPDRALAVALIARDGEQLARLCRTAAEGIDAGDGADLTEATGRRVFFSAAPLGRTGEIAFVFPGSGSQYPGMGRELAVRWPGVLRAQEARCTRLRSQLVPELIWNGDAADLRCEPRRLILAQVALGTVISDLVRSFGVEPHAVLGYSLGETAGLFALGAWHERDEMLRRVHTSDLFTEQLTGPCRAAARTWGLPEDEPVDWVLGVVDAPAAAVRDSLADRPRAYLLIVNSPDECVIGGQRAQVEAALAAMQAQFHELHSVTTVHCEVTKAVEQQYHDLHVLATDTTVPVRFYSGEAGRSYELSQAAAAASVTNQALYGIDYPAVVERAWEDGVRIFIELGPGASCTRMIRKILAGRPFAARAVCASGQDGTSALLRTLGMLVAERAPVDLAPLHVPPREASPAAASVVVPIGAGPLRPPAPPEPVVTMPTPTGPAPAPVAVPVVPPAPVAGPAGDLARATAAAAAAHDTFLRLSQRMTALVSQQVQSQFALIESLQGAPAAPAPRAPSAPAPLFDRAMCMEIAIGSIERVLGPEFAPVDAHPTRVRLPDEPLMLVDRIMAIEGQARSMTSGRIVTEHDVLPGKWYLDNGRIPTCIAVEAGQADLFLSGYLGIDFETQGLAVYRLLDAVVTFHDALPGAGATIHYEIGIKNFFRQGDTWLFRFEFEATVDGRPLITMQEGCAGFFTQAELDAGQGIVESRMDAATRRGTLPPGWQTPAPLGPCALDAAQVAALRAGDLAAAFGPGFAGLPLRRPLTLPTGRMELVHRVVGIDPAGGRYGIGAITAEADIHPDDWFLTCHFSDDMVMPGTLMYECCLHTLRVYLLRMGWVAEADDVVYQPVLGVRSRLKCRGQVLPSTKVVTYEVSIKELGYAGGDGEPFAIVDSLMYADGKPIVEINDMSVRLTGQTKASLEATWAGRGTQEAPAALYPFERILAFSDGDPSAAFGPPYAVFDADRVIARLPRPPFQFLDRIVAVTGAPFVMRAGATCRAQVDIDAGQWYFASNRQAEIPFAVLLEMALQPCGWLAAYVGSALTSTEDLKFRNLGGDAVQHARVLPADDTLTTDVELTAVSSSGGMIVQHYSYRMTNRAGALVYDGTTYFGFFSARALEEQIGIRDAALHEPDATELARSRSMPVPRAAPFPDDTMRMVDRVDVFVADGGPAGLGFVRGSIDVDPAMWFFDAHFKQDPVWPGSLGLEAFLQLLKVVAVERWGLVAGAAFATMPAGARHRWIYRGQVVPTRKKVTVQACITAVDDAARTLVAGGFLSVDGLPIYEMTDFALQVTEAGA